MKKNEVRLVLAFGVVFVTSSSFIILKADTNPYALAFVRVFLTGALSYFLLNKRFPPPQGNINKWDGLKILISGLSLATHFGWWFDSLAFLPVGISLSLTNTAPIWLTVIMYLFYNTKPSKNQSVSILLVLLGVTMLFLDNQSLEGSEITGLVLALGSAIGFAVYLIMAKSLVSKIGLWRYFGMVNFSSAFFLLLWVGIKNETSSLLVGSIWFYGILLAIFPGIMGHAVYNYSMSKLDPIDVSVATLGEPVLGTIIAFLFLSQTFSTLQSFGYTSLLMAIVLSNYKRQVSQDR